MKFDYCIGNPPYQGEAQGTSTSDDPVYNTFMDAAFEVSNKVELITPARFLFNAGKTPKNWNNKMLNDEHFKVLKYEKDSSSFFSTTNIPGGIAITYRDANKNFGKIGVFVSADELSPILTKIKKKIDGSLAELMYTQNKFNLNELYKDYPDMKQQIGSEGKDKRFRQIIMERFPVVFTEIPNGNECFRILGLVDKKRTYRFIKKKYVEDEEWLNKYKVFVPFSNGSILGDTEAWIIGTPELGRPDDGITQTFIGIGSFNSELEASNCMKYIKTKFARIALSTLKVTQGNKIETWENVPVQDFTNKSDISWNKSIKEIDIQLYKKYELSEDEINFIETHIKEMK